MATLQKIRNKFGVIAAGVIGLSVVAFILSDLFDSRSSWFQGSKFEIAEIAGNSVSYQQFEQKVEELIEIYKMNSGQDVNDVITENIREQAWEQLVNENVMNEEYDELGLGISSEELFDLIQGTDPHPIVRQIFSNPETGEFNKANLMQFLKNLNQDSKQLTYWLYVENEIKAQQLNAKYTNLIRKGISAPAFVAKNDYIENNKKVDFGFVVERLASIPDSGISVASSDLKKYYNAHKYLYEQNGSREIEYVVFDIFPSESDRLGTLETIEKLKKEFTETAEVEQFVGYNSDVAYNDKNFAKGELNDSLDAIMFNAQPGVVYGPYLDDNSYKMARLYKIVNIPDSVKARHILIRPVGQAQADMAKARSIADSLKNLIEKGADFAELAKNNSADRSNADKGGDLGWFKEGLMVKVFNDAAFEAEKGKTKVVESNFGMHILQVTDRGKEIKKVKVAFIERKIDASSETYSKIYNNAVRFSENTTYEAFNKAIVSQKLAKQYASIGESDRAIMGLESPRPVIRWAYNAKEKAISEPLDLGKKYVVAALVLIKEKGTAPMEIVKNEVELAVRKQKKGEKLTEKINGALQGAATLEVLASRLKTNVESETGISFSSFSLTTAGIEPRVIAEATNIQQGKLSGAIEGTNGVYVILVKNIVQPEAIQDYTATLTRINGTFQSRATYDGLGALRKLANIEDKRKKFY